jgi:hypothetical protein
LQAAVGSKIIGGMTRRRSIVALVASVMLALSGVALAAGSPQQQFKSPAAERAMMLEAQGGMLVDRAYRRVAKRRAACRIDDRAAPPATTQDAPAAATLAAFAPLRRPATAAELALREVAKFGVAGGTKYADSARSLTAADGTTAVLVVDRGTSGVRPPSASCLDAQRAALVSDLRGKAPALRRAALRSFAATRRSLEAQKPEDLAPHDRLFLLWRSDQGIPQAFGGDAVSDVIRHGAIMAYAPAGTNDASTVLGLVPDGVASVDLDYPQVAPRAYYRDRTYPSAVHLSIQVHDNLITAKVPRFIIDAQRPTVTWHDTAGATTQTIPAPTKPLAIP